MAVNSARSVGLFIQKNIPKTWQKCNIKQCLTLPSRCDLPMLLHATKSCRASLSLQFLQGCSHSSLEHETFINPQ